LHTEKNKKDFLDTCERSIGKELGQKVLNAHAELLSLADKMVNKTTKDFYQGDYQKKLEEMDSLLAQVAIQTQSQSNTYNFSLKNQPEADSKKANAVFGALQSMDAAVQAELHTHFWQASRTVENDTLISGFRQTRPPIYNVMSDKINITAETLTTTYGNIVSWKLKDPHNPGSELEKECQRDTKGNPLQLSVRELEQAVAAVNLDRLKNKQESIQIKFHNKGRRFTIDCLDQGTKKSLLDGMKAIQDKRVAEKEEKQAASVTTKNVTPTLSAGQGGSGTATSPRLSSV